MTTQTRRASAPPVRPAPVAQTAPAQGWVLDGLSVLSRGYLAATVGFALWAVLPLLLGWQAVLVTSASMTPALPVGSILVTAPTKPAQLRVGQVLLFDNPAVRGQLMSHRMVGTNSHGQVLTRGDANGSDDSTPVPTASVHGIGRLIVPAIGLPVLWARTGALTPLTTWALLTIGAVAVVGRTPTRARRTRGGQQHAAPTR